MPPYIVSEIGALIGVWGKPSSTLDWCEENYLYSSYVAEFCTSTLYHTISLSRAITLIFHFQGTHLATLP